MSKIKSLISLAFPALAAVCLALPLAAQAGSEAGKHGEGRGEEHKPRTEAGQHGGGRADAPADAASSGRRHLTKAERQAQEKVHLQTTQNRGAEFSRCRADAQAQGLSGVALRTAMAKCMNPGTAAN